MDQDNSSNVNRIFAKLYPYAIIGLFAILALTVVRASLFGAVDPEKHIYFEIVFLLLLAVLGEIIVLHFKQPSVMVLMLLGILISPSFFASAWGFLQSISVPVPAAPPEIMRSEEIIRVFAQLGAVILLFKVGLHSKLEGIFAFDNLLVAVSGVIVPFAAGFAYASMTGGNFAYSMFVGAALTATSVGVTVALLKEFKCVNERFAQIIIGAAVIDDILGLLVLSFVINLTGAEVSAGPMIMTALTALVFIVGSVVVGKYFVKYLDNEWTSGSGTIMLALALMLSYAYIAEFIKLSAIVGAFMAGIVMNQSRHHKEIEDKTTGLEILFMPIFFISLGMMVDVGALFAFAIPIIILTVIAFIAKIIPCTLAGLASRLPKKESLAIGIGMVPRGEVALIIASLGLSNGVLNAPQYSIISAMALLTAFLTPPLPTRVLREK